MSLKKSIFKNGVASILRQGVRALEQILLVPFFIKYWGAAYYGEWLTLTIVPSFIGLSDFGFGSAAANTFLLKFACGDKQGAANTAKTGFRILTYLTIGAILLTILILSILNYFGIFEKTLISSHEAVIAVAILMISKVFNFYQSLFEAYYRAARRASLSINLSAAIAALNIVGGFMVLVLHGNIICYAEALLAISIITNLFYGYCAIRTLPLNKDYKGKILKEEVKQIFSKGIGYLLSPIWQALYFQGSTFVVRIVLGPIAVTIFNTLRTLIRSSSQFFSIIIMATYPEFQFELAAGNILKAKKIFFYSLSANVIIAFCMIFGLSLGGNWLYTIWTHKSLNVPWDVWIAFICSILFYALWFTFSFIFEALNKPFQLTSACLLCAILSITISFFLISGLGLNGLGWGTLSFDVMMCVYLLPKGAKHFAMKTIDILEEAFFFLKKLKVIRRRVY